MTINSSRAVFFTAALAFAFMGCPSGGGGGTGGGSGSTGGGSASTGGGTGVTGGGSSTGGGSATGGGTATGGGSATGGGTGTGGGAAATGGGTGASCTEVQFVNYAFADTGNQVVAFSADLNPDTGGTDADFLSLEFYGNFNSGTFNLANSPDNNYETCAHCFVVYQDEGAKLFFQTGGTLVVSPIDGGTLATGSLNATLTNATLVEVTIDDMSFHSTIVDGGACLHVTSSTANVVHIPAPAGWTCADQYYGDGDCQCGCGAKDIDCAGTTDVTECTGCGCPTAAADGGVVPSYCDPANTAACAPVSPSWTCLSTFYGDNSCDCGCGITDSDCADAGIGACTYCDDPGSCTTAFNDAGVAPGTAAADGGVLANSCGYIDPANNAACQPLPPAPDAGSPADAGATDAGATDAG